MVFLKNLHLIFCHGWGYDKKFFQLLIDKLYINIKNLNYSIYNLDLNYFNNSVENIAVFNQLPDNTHIIWIGHSYGLIHGKINYDKYINAYIGINPVLNFAPYKANLRAMLRNFKQAQSIQDLQGQLNNFYIWCHDKNIYQHTYINRQNLIISLENMLNFELNLSPTIINKPNYLLIGKNDVFNLDKSMQELMQKPYLQNVYHQDSLEGGHLLVHTHQNEVIQFILYNIDRYLTNKIN